MRKTNGKGTTANEDSCGFGAVNSDSYLPLPHLLCIKYILVYLNLSILTYSL